MSANVAEKPVSTKSEKRPEVLESFFLESREHLAAVEQNLLRLERNPEMVGALVIAQSMVRQNSGLTSASDPVLARGLSQLTRVTAEVQRLAVSMRMARVSSLFEKTSRVARHVARKSSKQVSLTMEGGEAELDRRILDGLAWMSCDVSSMRFADGWTFDLFREAERCSPSAFRLLWLPFMDF